MNYKFFTILYIILIKNTLSFLPVMNSYNYSCNCSCINIDIKPSDCWHNEVKYSHNQSTWFQEKDAECICDNGRWINCD